MGMNTIGWDRNAKEGRRIVVMGGQDELMPPAGDELDVWHNGGWVCRACGQPTETEQYEANGQSSEAWILNWAADVVTEPEDRLRRRLLQPWNEEQR